MAVEPVGLGLWGRVGWAGEGGGVCEWVVGDVGRGASAGCRQAWGLGLWTWRVRGRVAGRSTRKHHERGRMGWLP